MSDNSVMWVYFNVPEARYLEYMADLDQDKDGLEIELVLANGHKFPQTGKLGAIEAKFNNETGTIAFRADFPNPDGLLRHGQTGTVLIHRALKNAIVIPQRATFETLDKRYVYVVGKDDVVHQREIVIQNELDDLFVIKRGVGVGDKIVLEGIRRVRDGEKVEYEFRQPDKVIATWRGFIGSWTSTGVEGKPTPTNPKRVRIVRIGIRRNAQRARKRRIRRRCMARLYPFNSDSLLARIHVPESSCARLSASSMDEVLRHTAARSRVDPTGVR